MPRQHELAVYRDRQIHRQVWLGAALLLGVAACSDEEVDVSEAPDAGAANLADAGEAPVPPEFVDYTEDGPMLSLPFEGRWERGAESFVFEFGEPELRVEGEYATREQALWCRDQLVIINDGLPDSNPPETGQLLSFDVLEDGECGPAYGTAAGYTALCSDVELRSFYSARTFTNVYAEVREIPEDFKAYTYADRIQAQLAGITGLGTGALPPAGDLSPTGASNAPTDSLGGLFFYGDLLPGAQRTVQWVFRNPPGQDSFVFRGRIVVQMTESCDNQDNDCDGYVDEGRGCYGAGVACRVDADCGTDLGGNQLLCQDNGSGVTTCGGVLIPEDCSQNLDLNGNGLFGCEDPTCSGVAPCADFSCVDGNLASALSEIDGDYLRFGTIASGAVSDFTLPSTVNPCGSRLSGADRAYLWTAPMDGEYTFSTAGSTLDTALVVVEGGCPVDMTAALANGEALCADDHTLSFTAENVVMPLAAGQTVAVILDSANPSTSLLGTGGWALSIFKTPVCGDGLVAVTDRFGNPTESCDAAGPSATCDTDCTEVTCGDGVINPVVESCEDGNEDSGDGCSAACVVESGYVCGAGGCSAVCGDGLIIAGLEVCDDGDADSGDGCASSCDAVEVGWLCATAGEDCTEICGDGRVVGVEVCDSPGAPGCTNCRQVDSGYTCPPTGGNCSDINECASGGGGCSVNGICNNTPGGYFCSCAPGYSGDGLQCDDINECDPTSPGYVTNGGCDPNATCANTEGASSCTCNTGFTGTGITCSDIDECIVGLTGGVEACDELAGCTNTIGGYTCGACPPGYSGTGATGCSALSCLDPGNPANGSLVGTATTLVLGTTLNYQCNTGYVATSGNATRTCVAQGGGGVAFDGAPLVCERRECTSVPSLGNATISNPRARWVFEDVATFACNSGWVPAGGVTPTALCGSDGLFTSVAGSCTRIDCGALSSPANGSVALPDGTLYQAEATYSCSAGYRLVGQATVECGADGNWSAGPPSCERITCTPPTAPANSTLNGGPYQYVSGEAVAFACNEGYRLSSPTPALTRTCLETGEYSAPANSCVLVDCGALTAGGGVQMTGSGTSFGSERGFSCNSGLTPNGSTLRVCQANGTWSGTAFTCTDCNLPVNAALPQCSALTCGAAPLPLDGRSVAPAGTSFPINAEATYACNADSTTNGLPGGGTVYTRRCVSTGTAGEWSLPTGSCSEITCEPLTASAPLSVSVPDRTFGGVATYSCGSGTRLDGVAQATCGASGWSSGAPACVTLSCPAPAPVSGGLVTPTTAGNAIGSTATHSCNSAAGFVAESGTTGQDCLDGGDPLATQGVWTWGGAPLVCQLRECPVLDVPDAIEAVRAGTGTGPNNRSVGTTIDITCAPGFVVQSTSVQTAARTCGPDGMWQGGVPVCVRRACGALPAAPGSVAGGASYSHPAGYSTPVSTTVATYTCAAGFRVGGSATGGTTATSTCGDDGAWSGWSGQCQAVTCGDPPVAAAGSNSARQAGWNPANNGTATYACTPGFSIDGLPASAKSYTATCQEGSGWVLPVSAADRTCEAFECPVLNNIVESGAVAATVSYVTPLGAPTTSRAYPNRAVYTRQTGFRLTSGSDSTIVSCTEFGTWSAGLPTYERMQCPAITSSGLSVVYRDSSNVATTNRYVGHTAEFGCSISGLAPTTGTQVCRETPDTNVRWEVPVGTAAPSVTCGNVNECEPGNPCLEDSDNRYTCTDRTPAVNGGPRYECGCNAGTGWQGTPVVNAQSTCDGICGDALVRGTEICDDGVWNDRPASGVGNPVSPHPRYPADCEGVTCDCEGPNAGSTLGCPGSFVAQTCTSVSANTSCSAANPTGATTPRAVCLQALAAAGQQCRSYRNTTAGRCGDGLDNDGDGLGDCEDPGCAGKGTCPNWREPTCAHDFFLPGFTGTRQYTLTNNVAVSPDRFPLGFGSQEDVSFLWTAPYPGTFVFETCSGTRSFDTVMGAYGSNTCSSGAGPSLGVNDDADANKTVRQGCSVVAVTAEQGEPVTIVVSAFGGNAGGTFPLVVYAQPNRSCGNAVVDAPIGLGMAANNRRVPDSRITASSFWASASDRSHAPELGRLYQSGTFSNWSAGANDLNQWLQVDFQAPVSIGAVATQGRTTAGIVCAGDGCGQRVTEYRVQWSNDGVNFTTVNNARADLHVPADPTRFPGNTDQETVRYNYFTPVAARYWRIVPTAWVNHITMRAEFFTFAEWCDDGNNASGDGCSSSCFVEPNASCFGGSPSACVPGATFSCGDGVVETNGEMYGPTLSNAAFSASSCWAGNCTGPYGASAGRIDSTTAWVVADPGSGVIQNALGSSWWQMDLGAPRPVAGAVTQGRRDCCAQYVTRYQVAYSNDGTNFTLVDGGRFFDGNNSAGDTRVFNRWATITARYWRIIPQQINEWLSMRADFFAPQYGYGQALPDSAFGASSAWPNHTSATQLGTSYGAQQARLDAAGDSVWHPADGGAIGFATQGASQNASLALWWQLDLGTPRAVASVGTRGRATFDQWTSSYRVGWSNDGVNFTLIEGGRVFAGNSNSFDVVYNGWAPVVARYWRIYPVTWTWVPVLRADFFPGLEVCDDGNVTNGDGCNSYCQVERDWRCYSQPSVCGGRRTLYNATGLQSTPVSSGWFGRAGDVGSSGSNPASNWYFWEVGSFSLAACATVTGVETSYTFVQGADQPADLHVWVHNPATSNSYISAGGVSNHGGWFLTRRPGNSYRNPGGRAWDSGSTPSTLMDGRPGDGSNWRVQLSDYVSDSFGYRLGSLRLDVYCRCLTPVTWYQDADGDGLGNGAVPQSGCVQPTGFVQNASDCNDANAGIGQILWFRDADGDNWTTTESRNQCTSPGAGWDQATAPTSPLDCDDGTQWRHPGRTETCDGLDNNCDGVMSTALRPLGNGTSGNSTVEYFNGCASFANNVSDNDECFGWAFNGRGYMLCHYHETWPNARTRCTERGMDLIVMSSQAENTAVMNEFHAQDRQNWDHLWIGALETATNSIFNWVNGTSAMSGFTNWGTTASSTSVTDAVRIYQSSRTNVPPWRWEPISQGQNHEFICENTENVALP